MQEPIKIALLLLCVWMNYNHINADKEGVNGLYTKVALVDIVCLLCFHHSYRIHGHVASIVKNQVT